MLAPAWLQLPSSKLGLETAAGLSELYSLAPHRKPAYPATQSGGRVSVPRSITCISPSGQDVVPHNVVSRGTNGSWAVFCCAA